MIALIGCALVATVLGAVWFSALLVRLNLVLRDLPSDQETLGRLSVPGGSPFAAAEEALGGRTAACGRLAFYLKLPSLLAPHKLKAAWFLLLVGGDRQETTAGRDYLLSALRHDKYPLARANAAEMLMNDPDSPDVGLALIEAMNVDADARVRAQAAGALRGPFTGQTGIDRALCKALAEDRSAEVRTSAASALCDRGVTHAECIASLCKALATDPSEDVRAAAAGALRQSRPVLIETVRCLGKGLADSSGRVRYASVEALARLLPQLRLADAHWKELASALEKMTHDGGENERARAAAQSALYLMMREEVPQSGGPGTVPRTTVQSIRNERRGDLIRTQAAE